MTEERKFHHHRKDFLDSDERRRLLDPEAIVSMLPLVPGDTVADVGCGTGFFTFPLARALRSGSVLAFDVQPEMVEHTRARMLNQHLINVEVHQSQEASLPLGDRSVDGVFAAFVLHETARQEDLLAELKRVLRPGGWLALLEFHKRPGEGGPPLAIRISPEEAGGLLAAAGFIVQESKDVSEMHYYLAATNGADE